MLALFISHLTLTSDPNVNDPLEVNGDVLLLITPSDRVSKTNEDEATFKELATLEPVADM